MQMTSEQWRTFFTLASRHILATRKSELDECSAPSKTFGRESYCAWTVFDRLGCDTIYWTAGLPNEHDLQEQGLRDGGEWGQPFQYDEIAHLIIPAEYTEDFHVDQKWIMWRHRQDIHGLSKLLDEASIPHMLHATFLELKLY